MTDANHDAAKVRAFGERLLASPRESATLASEILARSGLGDPRVNAVVSDFDDLTLWEKAGVVDELRDALDKQLGEVFQHYVKLARGNEASQ